MLMTKTRKKTNLEALEGSELQRALKAPEKSELPQISCIRYPAQFDKFFIDALINSGSKVNLMQPSFVRKLGF